MYGYVCACVCVCVHAHVLALVCVCARAPVRNVRVCNDREMQECADAAQALLQRAYYGALSTGKQQTPDEVLDLRKQKAFSMIPENLPRVTEKLQLRKARRALMNWASASREAKTEKGLHTKLYTTMRPPARSFPLGYTEAPVARGSSVLPERLGRNCTGVVRRSGSCLSQQDLPEVHEPFATRPRRKGKAPCVATPIAGEEVGSGKGGDKRGAREKVSELLALYQRKELPVFGGKLTSELL